MNLSTFWKLALLAGAGFAVWKIFESTATAAPDLPPAKRPGDLPPAGTPNAPLPTAKRPADLPPPDPNPSAMPTQLPTDPVLLTPGATYFVSLNVGGLLASFVGPAQLADVAQGEGFTNVDASQTRPSDWPSQMPAAFYVKGTYSGPAKAQSRALAPGVTIVDVYKA